MSNNTTAVTMHSTLEHMPLCDVRVRLTFDNSVFTSK